MRNVLLNSSMNRRAFTKAVAIGCVGYAMKPTLVLARHSIGLSDREDRFNVRDFGALGNGNTDDTQAFERALSRAAKGGGSVLVPAGRYPVKRSLHLADGVTLVGLGEHSVIDHSNGDPIVIIGAVVHEAGVKNLQILGGYSFAVLLDRSNAITVADCRIIGGTNKWEPSGYCGGIFLVLSNNVTLARNRLSGNGLIANGVLSSDIQINGFGDKVSSRGIRILDNQCRSTATQFCIAAYDMQHSEISRNVCSGAKTGHGNNNGYGILIYQRPGSPGSCTDNTVAENRVSETQGSAIYLVKCNHSRVVQNTIENAAYVQDDQTLPVGAVALNQSQYVSIVGNRIANVGRAGISIASNKPDVGHDEVGQNIISDVDGMGIHLRGTLSDIRVLGNSVTRTRGGIGGYTTDPQDKIVLEDNTVSVTAGSGPGIILGNAGESAVRDNRISDSGGFGMDLTLRDQTSEVAGNTVVRSGRAFGGKYPNTRIIRGKQPVILK